MEEAIYYIHINGQQKGPFPVGMLLAEGLTPETMVWRAGLNSWVVASSLPELAPLFEVRAPYGGYPQNPGYQQNVYGQNSFNQSPTGGFPPYGSNNMMPGQYPPGWSNWLGWAITGTVLGFLTCCIGLIFGIIAIVKSNQANTLARTGDYQRASAINESAKTWTIVSLIIGVIGLISCIVAFFTGWYADLIYMNRFN